MRRALALLACAAAPAALAADHREFWPELQAYVRLDPQWQLLLNPAPVRSRETGDRTNVDLGVYLDYRHSEHESWRFGYLRSDSAPSASEPRKVENRGTLDFTWKWGAGWRWSDRTRWELRDRDGSFSQRLRNRLQVEHATQWGAQDVVPYANAELFYDTRFDAFARLRGELGFAVVFSPQVDLTFYIGRQVDWKPQHETTDGFGLILALHY